VRDYKNIPGAPTEALASPEIHDDEPLPTYMAGLENYGEEVLAPDTWMQRQELRRQGYLTPAQLDRWAQIVRRGVVEL